MLASSVQLQRLLAPNVPPQIQLAALQHATMELPHGVLSNTHYCRFNSADAAKRHSSDQKTRFSNQNYNTDGVILVAVG